MKIKISWGWILLFGFTLFATFWNMDTLIKRRQKVAFQTGVLCGCSQGIDVHKEMLLGTNWAGETAIDEIFRRTYRMPGLPKEYLP